jgi:uncharacterized RmlC-like cupin family protein
VFGYDVLMQKGIYSIAGSLGLLLFGAAFLAAQNSNVVVENDHVRVLKVPVNPHEKTKMHEHKANRVMIYLQAGKQDINYQDGRKVVLTFKPGQALWSPQAGMHIAEISSDQQVTIVEIELKKPGTPGKIKLEGLDPLKIDAKHYKVDFENDQVRVVRVKIGGHETIPLHEHARNRVTTYLTDQDFQVTSADGKVEHIQHKAGDVAWGTPNKHKEENVSDAPFEGVMVELKN